MKKLFLAMLFANFISTAAKADDDTAANGTASIGVANYDDDNVTSRIVSGSVSKGFNLIPDQGWESSATVGGTTKAITFKEPADLLEKQLKGKDHIEEHSTSVAVNQGVGIGSSIGLLAGSTLSPLSNSRYVGLRLGQWWAEETFQTVVEFRKTKLEQATLDFVDTDGKRVITPNDLEGNNATLTLTHLTTPSTILRGAASNTKRSDRPDAWSGSGEIRQFIDATESAVHLAATHYENIGVVEARTTYGSVVSDTARIEWHQKIMDRSLVSLGYRYYFEIEDPRPTDAKDRQVGTDSIFGTWRWRFTEAAWTADSSEVSLFFNSFRANSGVDGLLLGSSLSYLF